MATTRFTQKQVGEQQVYIIRQRDDLPLVLFECVAFFIDDYFDPAERPTRLHAYAWAPDFDAALDLSGDHFSRRVQPCQSSELVGQPVPSDSQIYALVLSATRGAQRTILSRGNKVERDRSRRRQKN